MLSDRLVLIDPRTSLRTIFFLEGLFLFARTGTVFDLAVLETSLAQRSEQLAYRVEGLAAKAEVNDCREASLTGCCETGKCFLASEIAS
jgi:hypothetical protein